jgi:hypothetical protein
MKRPTRSASNRQTSHQINGASLRTVMGGGDSKVADVVAGTLNEINDGTTGGAVAAAYVTVVGAPLIAAAVLTEAAIGKVTSCFGLAN